MSRVLYVDCVAGVAGDMLLAALLDAGADEGRIRAGLEGLGVDGLRLEVGRADRHGIHARTVAVEGPHEHVHRTWREVRAIIDAGALGEWPAGRAH